MSTEATTRARGSWDPAQVTLIKAEIAKGATDAELAVFLEIAARYGLDPFAKEIWFTKGRGRNGQPGRASIIVGRDGLLRIARSQPGYKGLDCDVVREKDEFRVERKGDGTRSISHAYTGTDIDRGPIRGAWAEVQFEGQVPFYCYLPITEYKPKGDGFSPWSNQESVMMLKCAQSYVIRIACGIAGVLGEGEESRMIEETTTPVLAPEEIETSLAGMVNPASRERFTTAWEAVQEKCPAKFQPAVVEMSISGQTPEKQDAYIAEMEEAAAEADEPERVEEVTPPEDDQQAILRSRIAHLEEALAGFLPDEQREAANEEVELLNQRLRELAGDNPNQTSMPV